MELYCPACSSPVDGFLAGPGDRPDARCPHCQSLERHRFLALLIDGQAEAIASAAAILEFAPTAPIRQKILALQPARYVSIDLVSHFRPSVLGSITSLPLVTGSIDYILCYHILEHVDNDGAAIRELARVMTPQATAIIQVPRRKGSPTEEDPDASAEDRVVRFGQADHVRY